MISKFDEDTMAMINPTNMVERVADMPETVVAFFDSKIMDYFLKTYKYSIVGNSAIKKSPIYKVNINGKDIGVFLTGIGAPLCVALCEELVAMGAKNLLLFGACGVLVDIKEASIIIPTEAVRDEGTSYHYAPDSEIINLDEKYVKRLKELCQIRNIEYIEGKTWSTDGFYRETKGKVAQRIKEGCICVEMECSALMAFAKLRGVNFAQFFYAADSLAKEEWDVRILQDQELKGEERALALALDFATKIFD